MPDAESVRVCGAQEWKHVCHLSEGHHGLHACTSPGDRIAKTYGGCEFTWPNENFVEPCPSTEVAVLGVVGDPARLRCGLLLGHDGAHRFVIEWSEQLRIKPGFFADVVPVLGWMPVVRP